MAIAELLNGASDARWGNLGAWEAGDGYEQAARRLAHELGEWGRLGTGQRVLDIGCGCGDQLIVWIESFGVEEVVAIEPDPALLAAARARLASRGLLERVSLRTADASALAELPTESFDRVVALDCAYFFGDRRAWVRQAFRLLRSGGVLAATDLVLGAGTRGTMLERLAPIFGIASDHLVSPDDHREEHAAAGFSETELQLATERVLGGFARHVGGRLPDLLGQGGAALPVLLTAAACRWSVRSERLGYAFVRSVR